MDRLCLSRRALARTAPLLVAALIVVAASCADCEKIPCATDTDCGAGGVCPNGLCIAAPVGGDEGEGEGGEGEGGEGEGGEGEGGEGEGEGEGGEGEGGEGEGEGEGGEGVPPVIDLIDISFPRLDTVHVKVNFHDVDGDAKLVLFDFGDGSAEETVAVLGNDTVAIRDHLYTQTISATVGAAVLDLRNHSVSGTAPADATAFPGNGDITHIAVEGNSVASDAGSAVISNGSSGGFDFVSAAGGYPRSTQGVDLSSQNTNGPAMFATQANPQDGSFTISVWLNPNLGAGAFFNNAVRIAGQGGGLALHADNGTLRFGVIGSGAPLSGTPVADSGAGLPEGVWTHVVGVANFTNNTVAIYENGVKMAAVAGGLVENSCRIYFGDIGTGDNCTGLTPDDTSNGLVASLDEINVFGRVLSDAEITLLFQGAP